MPQPPNEFTPSIEETDMRKIRIEHDLLGDREVTGEAYYGVRTLRAQREVRRCPGRWMS